jgi:hypothetical protein
MVESHASVRKGYIQKPRRKKTCGSPEQDKKRPPG